MEPSRADGDQNDDEDEETMAEPIRADGDQKKKKLTKKEKKKIKNHQGREMRKEKRMQDQEQ